MLSFVNSFRAVARRQACRAPAARAMSSASAQTTTLHPITAEPSSMQEFSDFIHDITEEEQTLAAGNTGELVEELGPQPPVAAPPLPAKGFPVLTGFHINQFVRPQDFTRDGYAKIGHKGGYTKRALLGPDASTSRYLDVFHQMDIDPLQEAQNSKIMSRFVSTMGKIKGRSETNLTWKNQRRIGKAIRRAKMMGVIPVLSRRNLLQQNLRR